MSSAPGKLAATTSGIPSDLTVRVNRRARRISLRLDATGQAVLVLPDERLRAEGLRFAAEKRDWLAAHRARHPKQIAFAIGETVPLRGLPHRISFDPGARDPVALADGLITVAASPASASRLVTALLKHEAGRDLRAAVDSHSNRLELAPPPITLRDPKTRWGSCSARRTLSLSWRLIMAPPPVLDYVAAHEVAHLREMNHSRRFWAIVAELCPSFREHEAWLRRHGLGLHRYG